MISTWVKAIASPLKKEPYRADEATRHKAVIKALYQRNGDDIFHFLLTLSDYHLAQDVSQQLWLKLLEKPEIVKRTNNLKCYLFQAARNAVIDEYRKLGKHDELTDAHLEQKSGQNNQGNQDSNAMPMQFTQQVFDEALMALPFLQREAFCLQQEDLSLNDIAQITGSNAETIKTRLRYAKTNLRKQLQSLKREIENG